MLDIPDVYRAAPRAFKACAWISGGLSWLISTACLLQNSALRIMIMSEIEAKASSWKARLNWRKDNGYGMGEPSL